jgi:hypothetical protein
MFQSFFSSNEMTSLYSFCLHKNILTSAAETSRQRLHFLLYARPHREIVVLVVMLLLPLSRLHAP